MLSKLLQVVFLILLLATAVAEPAWPMADRFDDVERVVAISDIHGAYDAMVATLQRVEILGSDLDWRGGRSHLVIVGDILDRGPDSRLAMDLLMRLEGEAEAAGGKVHVLVGNHEAMILEGDMRYVSAAEYQAFSDDETAAERSRWLELYAARNVRGTEASRQEFDKQYPPGYFAMRRAFAADAKYGEWLLSKNIIVVINGTAFVHGGLSPIVSEIGLEGVNQGMQGELVQYVKALNLLVESEVLLPTDSQDDFVDILRAYQPSQATTPSLLEAVETAIRLSDSELLARTGPLWYRNNTRCPRIVEEHRFNAALAALGANRLVVGHSPTPNRQIQQRFDGRLLEIDTGMLNSHYAGMGHALVLEGDSVVIVNQGGDRSLRPVEQLRKVGRRPGDLTPTQLGDLLAEGDVLPGDDVRNGRSGRTIVSISDGDNTVRAIFSQQKGRGFFPSIAAYRLDRLLQLDMVPVTVAREIDGKKGSLQFWPEKTIDELERVSGRLGSGAWCTLQEQWPAMPVFDALIYNDGRTQERILYDESSWRLILSEHDRAFSTRKGRPPHLKDVVLDVTPGWVAALEQLSDDLLDDQLGDVLGKRRIKALKARRDQLLAGQ